MTAPFGRANFQSKEPRLLPDKEWVPQYFLKELAQPQPRHHRQPWPENRLDWCSHSPAVLKLGSSPLLTGLHTQT